MPCVRNPEKLSRTSINCRRLTLMIGVIIVWITVIMSERMLKPVYLRNRDLDNDHKNHVTDFELLESVTKCITDTKCIQKDRDLWRIYVGSNESRNKLLNEGFEFRNTTAQAFETNPFSAGTSSPTVDVLKITVKVFRFLWMIMKLSKCWTNSRSSAQVH